MTEQSTSRRYDNLYLEKPQLLGAATLPTTGSRNGDAVQYLVATSVLWTFVYDAASAYWVPQGPVPLFAYDAASFASSTTATWQVATTPSITVPFAGDYDVATWSVTGTVTSAGFAQIGPATSGTPTPPLGNAAANILAGGFASMIWRSTFLGVAAGTQFRHSQWTNDATPGHTTTTTRTISVTPLRVH